MDQEQNVELRDEVAEAAGHDMKNAEAQSVSATSKAGDATSQSELPTEPGASAKHNTKKDPMPKTKAGMVNAMFSKMNSMPKVELTAAYGKMMGEEVEIEEEVVESADFSDDLEALVESEATLSEEFKQKTAIIFEAALKSKLSEEIERIESTYEERFAEETQAHQETLVEQVDSYLNYVVENWMEENKLAVQNGLRTEISEDFMNGLKTLFQESYIEVPESKVDLVDDLADQVEELEEALNKTTAEAIKLSEETEMLQRMIIVSEAMQDLTDTQAEKFEKLVEGVEFDSPDQFTHKLATIKESFFNKQNVVIEEDVAESMDGEAPALDADVHPFMQAAIDQLRRSQK